ncbi:MAG TPA: glycoside hydrolase family 3 N-terminal domain-containing protein [Mycobacteriales bacterium]|nr:glycoside hydrolase family 3 N-terminal domain-containing protein [Mycobacteriales bacterium]
MIRAAVLPGLVVVLAGSAAPVRATSTPAVVPTPPPVTAPAPPDLAHSAYRALTSKERIGQLFMVGVPASGPSAAKLAHLHRLAVGSVILDGNSSAGRSSVSATTSAVRAGLRRSGVAPFIATDQEGGQVQRFTGPGFSRMPTALEQGRWSVDRLRREAGVWSRELSQAGLSLNLAPVADVVPSPHARANQPIGRYDREFGHTPRVVARHVAAFVDGETAHVAVTLKHFPGLGRATGNTDLTRNVTDPTTRDDGYLAPFRAGLDAGAPFVMVSLASYPHIDPGRPACFSSTVMKTMLRESLDFDGVILSDSFHAVAVRHVPPAEAAIRFFRAGGTMLLDTDIAPVRAMERAVLRRATHHPGFARALKASVIRVLRAKAAADLIA